jgi:hypothetical protein
MRSADFYWKKLGFGHPRLLGNPPAIAEFQRDGFLLYLHEAEFDVTISPSGGCDVVIRVDNLEAELDALRAQEVPIDFGPVEVVDGLRKHARFEIVDPDGYRTAFEKHTWLTAGHSF